MAKPKATFFEQVPLAVVKQIAGVEVSVNHAVASRVAVRKPKRSKVRRPATFIATRRSGRREGKP